MLLKIFASKDLNIHFELPPDTLCAWVLESDWNNLLVDFPSFRNGKEEFFVKLECLNQPDYDDFCLFTLLAKLPNDTAYLREGEGLLWISQELIPKIDFTINKRSIVNVSIVNESYLTKSINGLKWLNKLTLSRMNKIFYEHTSNKTS